MRENTTQAIGKVSEKKVEETQNIEGVKEEEQQQENFENYQQEKQQQDVMFSSCFESLSTFQQTLSRIETAIREKSDCIDELDLFEKLIDVLLSDNGFPADDDRFTVMFLTNSVGQVTRLLTKKTSIFESIASRISNILCKIVRLFVMYINENFDDLYSIATLILCPYSCSFYEKIGIYQHNSELLQSDVAKYAESQETVFALPKQNKALSAYCLRCVNTFDQHHGYKKLIDRLRVPYEQLPPPKIVNKILTIISYGACMAREDRRWELIDHTKNAVFTLMLDVNEETLKNTEHNVYIEPLSLLKQMLFKHYQAREAASMWGEMRLDVALKLLRSSSLDKQIKGLGDIKAAACSSCKEEKGQPKYRRSGGSANDIYEPFMTPSEMVQWLRKESIIELLFQQDYHSEVIRQCSPLVMLMAKEDSIRHEDIDIIWSYCMRQPDADKPITYNLIISLTSCTTPNRVDYIWRNIHSIPYNQLTLSHLNFVFYFTVAAVANNELHKVRKERRSWYGLDMLWHVMKDKDTQKYRHSKTNPSSRQNSAVKVEEEMSSVTNSHVIEEDGIAHAALDRVKQLLSRPEFSLQRKPRMEQAVLCLKRGDSVPQVLDVFSSIISTYPTTSKKRRKKKSSMSGIIESLEERHSILGCFFEDLKRYKQAIHASLSDPESGSSSKISSPLLSSRYSHLQHVRTRLEFLSFILSNSKLSLSFSQVKELWKLLYDEAIVDEEKKACIEWIESARKGSSPHSLRTIFDESATDQVFHDILLKLPPSTLSESLFSLIRTFFIHINVRSGNLQTITITKHRRHYQQKQRQKGPLPQQQRQQQGYRPHHRKRKLQTINDHLIGINYLWDIVVEANDAVVCRSARKLLNTVHHDFGREALAHAPQYREAYIEQAVQRMTDYASHVKNGVSSSECSAESEDGTNGTQRNQDHKMYEQYIRRVLDLVQEYITLFRRGGRDIPDNKDAVGKPLCVTVAVPGKPELTFKMTVYTSDSVDHILSIVARELSIPYNLIQIKHAEHSLAPSSALLKDFDVRNNSTLFIIRRTVKEAALDAVLRLNLESLGMRTDGLAQAIETMHHRKHNNVIHSTPTSPSNGATTPQPSESNTNNNTTASSDLISYGDTDGVSDSMPAPSADSVDSGEYVVLSTDDSAETFPAAILARDEYFSRIIDLLSLPDTIASEAWSLLMMLPSNRNILDSLRHFEGLPHLEKHTDNGKDQSHGSTSPQANNDSTPSKSWIDVLDSSSVYKLLYALQIIDVLRQDASDPTWSSRFVKRGGLQHLVHIIISARQQHFIQSLLHFHCLTLLLKTISFFIGHMIITDGNDSLLNPASLQDTDIRELANRTVYCLAGASLSIHHFTTDKIKANTTTAFDSSSTERDLIEQGFALLRTIVQIHPTLLQEMCQHPRLDEWLRRSLLVSESPSIRREFARGFHRMITVNMSNASDSVAHALSHMAQYMLSLLSNVSDYSQHCHEFFDLLVDLFSSLHTCGTHHAFPAESHLRHIVEQIMGTDLEQNPSDNTKRNVGDKFRSHSSRFRGVMEKQEEKEEEEKEDLSEDLKLDNANDISDDDDEDETDEEYQIGLLRVAEALLRCVSHQFKRELGSKCSGDLVRKLTYGVFQIGADQQEYIHNRPDNNSNNNNAPVQEPSENMDVLDLSSASPTKMLHFHSKGSRKAAFGMLAELVEGVPENYDVVAQQVYDLVQQCETPGPRAWAVNPAALERPSAPGFVGLRNQGATCYMNSLLQQLFMTYGFRRGIFSAHVTEPEGSFSSSPSTEGNNNDSNYDNIQLLWQLQRMFGFLQESEKQFYDTLDFCTHYKDFGGESINMRQQQDANEFLSVLFDRLEHALKGTPQQSLVSDVFGGTLANDLMSLDAECGHGRSGTEPFYAVGLEIKGKQTIEESLAAYIQGEVLDKDNKWKCDACQRRVPARKRSMFKDLPPVLILQLKRFEFDLRRMRNVKVNDRCEFPTFLDMHPYTVTSDDPNPKDPDATETNDTGNQRSETETSATAYELVGVLVHTGTADSGHYYSFIKDTDIFSETGKWIEFNDRIVRYFDPQDMAKECFGGTEDVTLTLQGKQVTRTYTRNNNAYMLFYRRCDVDRNFVPNTVTQVPSHASMNPETKDEEEGDNDDNEEKDNTSITTTTTNVKKGDDRNNENVESAAEDAEHDGNMNSHATSSNNHDRNLWKQSMTAMRFLSRMKVSLGRKEAELSAASGMPPFVKRLVREDNMRFLRSKAIFNPQFDAFMWQILSTPTRRESKIFNNKTVAQLATRFVVDILSHSRHKSSLPQWFDFLRDLITSDVELCKWLIMSLTPSAPEHATNWFSDIVLFCPFSEVRSGFVDVVVGCIHTLSPVERYRPDLIRPDLPQGQSPNSPGSGECSLLDETNPEEEETEAKAEYEHRRQLYYEHSLTFFVHHVTEMVHSCRMQRRTPTQLFLLACRIAGAGPGERSFLLQIGMLSSIVDVLTPSSGSSGGGGGVDGASANYQCLANLPKSGIVHLMTLSSLLLRSCRPREGVMPPTSLDECHNSLPVADKRFFTSQFLLRLIHDSPHPPAQREILRHWCWESANVSYNIAEAVIRKLDEVPTDQYNNYYEAITTILHIDDSVSQNRVQKILDYFMERLQRRSKDAISTLSRIRYITRLSNNENCKAWMHSHMGDLENICTQHGWELRHKNRQKESNTNKEQ